MFLVDNILSPDDITKVSLEIKPKTYLEDESPSEAKAKVVKQIVKLIKLEEKLETVVYDTLLFGDFFCEIGDVKTALTSRSILTESETYLSQRDEDFKAGLRETLTFSEKDSNFKVDLDFTALSEKDEEDPYEEITDEDKIDKKRRELVRNLTLVFHSARHVITLQSSLFPICFGYLLFPNVEGMGIAGVSIADETVNQICMQILKSIEKKIPQMKEFKDNKELVDIIKAMLKNSDPTKALDIRYIPPDRMVHFHRPTTKYYPYGESIFDSTQYSSKVLMALQTALAVQRLSRSKNSRVFHKALKRKI